MMSANAFIDTKDPVFEDEVLMKQKAELAKAMPEF